MASKTGSQSLAAIYAQALYEAAGQAKALELVIAELGTLRQVMDKAPRLERFLVSPTIAFADKRKLIEKALGGFSKTLRNFLLVLVDRKRAQIMEAIVSAFMDLVDRKSGVCSVEVQSATALTADERQKLLNVLQAKLKSRVRLSEKVRPELLGGMVLIHEDKMWDASKLTALERLMEKMETLKLATIKWTE